MEGYWLNVATGKYIEVPDHAEWIEDPKNARRIGLSPRISKSIVGLNPLNPKGRVEILLRAMKGGLIRVRSHGNFITFEFTTNTGDALWAAERFLAKTGLAGPFSTLLFNNLRTKKSVELSYNEFEDMMKQDPELVMHEQKSKFNYSKRLLEAIEKRLREEGIYEY